MQSSSLMQVRLLTFKFGFRHITYVTYLGFSTKIPTELEKLILGKDKTIKMAAFAVSREGRHYSRSERLKIML